MHNRALMHASVRMRAVLLLIGGVALVIVVSGLYVETRAELEGVVSEEGVGEGGGGLRGGAEVVDGAWVGISVSAGGGREIWAKRGGLLSDPSAPLVGLVHGGSSKQTGEHWDPFLGEFGKVSKYLAFDMLGKGRSVGRGVSVVEQRKALAQALEEESGGGCGSGIVLVGRSWGGGVVLGALGEAFLNECIIGLILIAPATSSTSLSSLSPALTTHLPVLLVWAKDDPVMRFDTGSKQILATFPDVSTLFFDKVITDGVERWMGHAPELVHPDLFAAKATEFIQKVQRMKAIR